MLQARIGERGDLMGLLWDEAVAAVTGPGARFETAEAEIGGVRQRVYKNAPASLRALFEAARAHGDETFLVYEDERLSFAPHSSAATTSHRATGWRSRCATTPSG
jgi:long-chain acyl-CoA synthetase